MLVRKLCTEGPVPELQALVNGRWPRLQCLNLKYWAELDISDTRQLSKASWSSLASLDLSGNSLGADAMSQLILGNWPALHNLNLSHTDLDTAAVAWLSKADWPLETLVLFGNKIGVKAMKELVKASLPMLKHLGLQYNNFDVDAFAVLATMQWPLQRLDLGHNGPFKDAALAVTELARGRWLSISIGRNRCDVTHYQITEIQLLVNGSWPRLQRLNLRNWGNFQSNAVRQLSTASWSSLASLDLSNNFLGANAMSHLASGKWPALKRLNLSNTMLDIAAMAWLAQADWPLEELQLDDNRLDVEAMEKLVQGNWPKLKQLTLQSNKVHVHSIAVLVSGQWPLRHLALGQNYVDDDGMAVTQLRRATWPDLLTLVLAGNMLSAKTMEPLCQADWPHLKSLDLSTCSLLDGDIAGLSHLVKANWPALKYLHLKNNLLTDAAVKVLAINSWPKLEYLDLRLNKRMSRNAARLLSREQQRVAVF